MRKNVVDNRNSGEISTIWTLHTSYEDFCRTQSSVWNSLADYLRDMRPLYSTVLVIIQRHSCLHTISYNVSSALEIL